MIKAYQIRITGRVTGVGFRYSALQQAALFPGLGGYVRNVGYREVEAVVQGKSEVVGPMLDWLKIGPPGARVDNIVITAIPVDSARTGFIVR
jgi:acylphosphatase